MHGKNGWRPSNVNSGILKSRIQSIKRDALIIYGGKEVAKLEKTLPNPETGKPLRETANKIKQSLPTQEEQALRPIPIPQVATKPRRIDEQLRSETSRKSNRLRVRRHS